MKREERESWMEDELKETGNTDAKDTRRADDGDESGAGLCVCEGRETGEG